MAIKPRVEEAKSRGSCARRICGEIGRAWLGLKTQVSTSNFYFLLILNYQMLDPRSLMYVHDVNDGELQYVIPQTRGLYC